MKVFVTGATGLLGINTINELLARNHSVVALVRNRDKARRVLPASDRMTLVDGDLAEPNKWINQMRGTDALVHAAAYFTEYFGAGDHAAKLQAWNVDLPVRLAQAASDYGLQKTLMVSSSGAVFPRPDNQPTDETTPPQSNVSENAYFASKVRMENALQTLAPKPTNTLLIVRPGWMFGPNDFGPTGAGQLVLTLLQKGAVQLVGGSPTNIADARDVAKGIVSALEKTSTNEIFNLAGTPFNAIEAFGIIAKETGGKVQTVPLNAALFLSAVLEPVSRLQKKPNPIPRVGLLTLNRGVSVSSEKARRDLGVTFRAFEETAKDTVLFFRERFSP